MMVEEDVAKRREKLQSLCGYTIKTDFDRRLVLGMLGAQPSKQMPRCTGTLYEKHAIQPMRPIDQI